MASEEQTISKDLDEEVAMDSTKDKHNFGDSIQSQEEQTISNDSHEEVAMDSTKDEHDFAHSTNLFDGSQGVIKKSAKSLNKNLKKETQVKRKPIQWIQRHSVTMSIETWEKIHKGQKLIQGGYAHQFAKIINSYGDMPCVLRSNGYHLSRQKFVIRFQCTHPECERSYQVKQIEDNHFVIFDNGTQFVHNSKRTRPVRGAEREDVREKLLTQYPKSYKKKSESAKDAELFKLGNLQNIKSTSTLKVIRHEAIESFDYDKDDIFDLFKMKIIADSTGTDQYIQRITGVPFAITCFSRYQFDCLRKAAKLNDEVTFYFDATGGVVRHSTLRIYYYAGVVAVNILNEKTAKVVPIIQFVNGKHDSFNIKIPLDEMKTEFHKLFPDDQWPIKYAVTDFSFASLNAICYAWNRMDLIEYINMVYNGIVFQSDMSKICTYLQLCIGHLSKTFAKDVDRYFPDLPSSKQAVLQEIFAGMCNCCDLNQLRNIWTNLSTLLLSRFVSNVVHNALQNLAVTMLTPFEKDESVAIPEEDRLPDAEKIENGDSIYKQSLFYQFFKTATFKEEFKVQPGAQNAYYSVEFADIVLKKYFSIACLWTCLTQKARKANTYVEGHFKVTKGQLVDNAVTLGTPPLKCGRFIRWMLEEVKSVAVSVLEDIPSERLCGYKPRATPKSRIQKNTSLVSLYNLPQSKNVVNASQIETSSQESDVIAQTSSQSAEVVAIDDPYIEENWSRKSKAKHSFFKQKTLCKISTGTHTELSKILEEVPNQKSKQRDRKTTMKNNLISKPEIYLAAEFNIAVACIGKLILKQAEYKLLQFNNHLNSNVINYIFAAFQPDYKQIQFEAFKTEVIVAEQPDLHPLFNIKKSVLIASLLLGQQFSLLIIDSKKKTFSYVNPSMQNPSEVESYYKNFLKFVVAHNNKFKIKIPDHGWSNTTFAYQTQEDVYDSGVLILNFTNQFLTSSKMSNNFDPKEYRLELQHLILRKATNMKDKCVICGYKVPPNYKLEKVEWIQCCSCARWDHIPCAQLNTKGLEDDFSIYLCFICKASTLDHDHVALDVVDSESHNQ